jgi:hypothetical protein
MVAEPTSIRHYEPGDYPMLLGWWNAHGGAPMDQTMIPPSSCVVVMFGEPVAFGAVFLCNSNHVAFFHGMVTCPRLTLRDAKEALHALQGGLDIIMRNGGHTLLLGTVPAGAMMKGARWMGFASAGDPVIPVQRLVKPLTENDHGS